MSSIYLMYKFVFFFFKLSGNCGGWNCRNSHIFFFKKRDDCGGWNCHNLHNFFNKKVTILAVKTAVNYKNRAAIINIVYYGGYYGGQRETAILLLVAGKISAVFKSASQVHNGG